MPSGPLSYLTCFDRCADVGQSIWGHSQFALSINCTQKCKFNFHNFNQTSQELQNDLNESNKNYRFHHLCFRFIMFLEGLCWLIMESTSRRGNSNYFPWLRSKPLHLIQRTIPPQTPRPVIGKHLHAQFHKSHSPTKDVCHSKRTSRGLHLHSSYTSVTRGLDRFPKPRSSYSFCWTFSF